MRKFLLIVILISAILIIVGLVQELIFNQVSWLYLSIYVAFFGIIPSVIFLIIFTISQKGNRLPKIDQTEIEIAEIKKNLYDTISVQLNEQQISKFVEILNTDSPAELRKALPKYWLFVKFKSGSMIHYKILDRYIGEKDLYVKTDQAVYFEELYDRNNKTKHLIPFK